MAARKNKVRLTENWKERIRTSMLLNRLNDHALGEVEMSSTQVDAAKYLLNKIISNAPTDQNVNHAGEFVLHTTWLMPTIVERN